MALPMISELTRTRYQELEAMMRRQRSHGRWLVLTHDNPDPDAIAAAAGLSLLLREVFDRKVTTAYGGIIGRAENREMVKVLGIRKSQVRYLKWGNYRHFALVDTQPETGNNQLPAGTVPEIVFDHHPIRRASYKSAFIDIRPDYGATATLIAEYLEASSTPISRKLATALIYAIRTETQDFRREFVSADKTLHDSLLPQIDNRALGRIQSPRLPLSYFRTIHRALESLLAVETLVVGHVGDVDQPDIVPEIADLLIRLDGKTWSLCTGRHGERLYLSLRTSNPRADAGRIMRRLVGRRGKGGGHGMTAGGWVALNSGIADSTEALEAQLAARLATYLKKNPERLLPVLPETRLTRPEPAPADDAP